MDVVAKLITWMSDRTPVLGKADESLEEAPTHQTEPEGGLPVNAGGWSVAFKSCVAEDR